MGKGTAHALQNRTDIGDPIAALSLIMTIINDN